MRKPYIALASQYNSDQSKYSCHVTYSTINFVVSLETALEQNQNRERTVPNETIEKLYKITEWPETDENCIEYSETLSNQTLCEYINDLPKMLKPEIIVIGPTISSKTFSHLLELCLRT